MPSSGPTATALKGMVSVYSLSSPGVNNNPMDLWTDLQTEDIKAYILLFYCSPKSSWSYFRDTEDSDTDLGKKQNTPQKNNVLARYEGDLTLASV